MNNIKKLDNQINQEQSFGSLVELNNVQFQVAVAQNNPRDVGKFIKDMENLIKSDKDIAQSCFYVLKRGDRDIEGPGIRLVEMMLMYYRNITVAGRVAEIGDKYIRAQAYAYDSETNISCATEVTVPIVNKKGERYSDELIGVVANAAVAKARRNAVLSVIPRVFAERFVSLAKKVLVSPERTGKKSPVTRFEEAVKRFSTKYRITEEALLRWLGVSSKQNIADDDLTRLVGLWNSLEDGETTLEQEGLVSVVEEKPTQSTPAPAQAQQSKPQDIKKKFFIDILRENLQKNNIAEQEFLGYVIASVPEVGNPQAIEDLPLSLLKAIANNWKEHIAKIKPVEEENKTE